MISNLKLSAKQGKVTGPAFLLSFPIHINYMVSVKEL